MKSLRWPKSAWYMYPTCEGSKFTGIQVAHLSTTDFIHVPAKDLASLTRDKMLELWPEAESDVQELLAAISVTTEPPDEDEPEVQSPAAVAVMAAPTKKSKLITVSITDSDGDELPDFLPLSALTRTP